MTSKVLPGASIPSGMAAQLLLALVGGAAAVPSFAPCYLWPLGIASLSVLFGLWQTSRTVWRAFSLGFAWGLGLFAAGVSWIYVSLHVYGSMPAGLAGLATLLFCCYLALYPALAGVLFRAVAMRCRLTPSMALLVWMPACFVAFEYLRGWVVSGFPWLTMGYAQTPGGVLPVPLSGYAPVVGVYGISWLVAVTASCAVLLLRRSPPAAVPARRAGIVIGIALLAIWSGGALLLQVSWSEPSGSPLRVALLQGNVEQSLKWRDDQKIPTLANYHQLVTASRAKLIVLPETALPDLLDRIPTDYLESVRLHAAGLGGDVLAGVPIVERPAGPNEQPRLANSAVSMGVSPSQRYDKHHLVAFGEFVPPMFSWVYRWLRIPLADFNSRAHDPSPMLLSGHKIAVNICYEDAFGREIAAQLPDAELLVNMSNMAWFGESLAADQHAQMSQMRALETGRWMLRATNTGATAAINDKGIIVKRLPAFTRGTLEIDAQPMTGLTPYGRWRDAPVLVFLAACLLSIALGRRRIAISSP